MRIGAFEFAEPVPELRTPHVIASLTPWVDAGSIATVALKALERQSGAQDLGSLATPGTFFDFTRYRPVVEYQDDQRRITLPNTRFRWSRGSKGFDFIFLHMLEPHAFAEEYIDSVLKVLEHFKVHRICRIGGMYDAVPPTRPLLVTGSLNGEPLQGVSGIVPPGGNPYQGPTSIAFLMGDKLTALGIENMNLMARLPQYVQLEEDYSGAARLLEILCALYDLPPEPALSRRGVRQYERISAEVEGDPRVKALLRRMEADYDAREQPAQLTPPSERSAPRLSPSVEQFLGELDDQAKDS